MLVLLLVVIAVLGVAAYQTIKWAQGPVVPPEQHPPSKVVVIPDGVPVLSRSVKTYWLVPKTSRNQVGPTLLAVSLSNT